jgi:hypothetical protein
MTCGGGCIAQLLSHLVVFEVRRDREHVRSTEARHAADSGPGDGMMSEAGRGA